MMATSADIFPFLKASQWRYSVSPHTPGENPRSSDRVLAALLRRDLLEDIVEAAREGADVFGVWGGEVLPALGATQDASIRGAMYIMVVAS